MEYILETKNLEKKYKKFSAISNLNMHVPKGAIYMDLLEKMAQEKPLLLDYFVVCKSQLQVHILSMG